MRINVKFFPQASPAQYLDLIVPGNQSGRHQHFHIDLLQALRAQSGYGPGICVGGDRGIALAALNRDEFVAVRVFFQPS